MIIPVKDIKIEKVDKITIEELYNFLSNKSKLDLLENGTEVLIPDNVNINCESINGKTGIKNISRHKVCKDRWSVSVKNKKLNITSDHSIMVYRDGNVIEVRPEDLKDTDCLIVKKEVK